MIFDQLCQIISRQMDVELSSIRRDTNVVEDLGADSLDIAELLTILEDEFNVVLVDDRIRELYTVGEIAEYLESVM
ncbi:MAG: acyl carrier protein [Oscillospiraceae bacterium]|nr:acyl carrier protein [Oscillospiraceae bacterium]